MSKLHLFVLTPLLILPLAKATSSISNLSEITVINSVVNQKNISLVTTSPVTASQIQQNPVSKEVKINTTTNLIGNKITTDINANKVVVPTSVTSSPTVVKSVEKNILNSTMVTPAGSATSVLKYGLATTTRITTNTFLIASDALSVSKTAKIAVIQPSASLSSTSAALYLNLVSTVSDSMLRDISQSNFNLADVFTSNSSKSSNLILDITKNKEQFNYALKSYNTNFYKNTASGTEKIISLPKDKKTLIDLSTKHFVVAENNIIDYSGISDKDQKLYFDAPFLTETSGTLKYLDAYLDDNCVYLEAIKGQKPIKICDNIEISPSASLLVKEKNKIILKNSPDIVYGAVKKEIDKHKFAIKEVELAVEKNNAKYRFRVEEDKKLFGFIPVKLRSELIFSADENKFEKIDYSWLGLFFKKPKLNFEIKIGPNLMIEKVDLSPLSVHTGDKLKIAVKIKNNGNKHAGVGYTSAGGPSYVSLYFGDDLQIDTKDTGYFLFPDESLTIYLEWKAILCNVPITVKLDSNSRLDELDENDNAWQYQVKCAPTNAPDLKVKETSFDNNTKRVGSPNVYRMTFMNDGYASSPESTAFLEYGGLSTSILVPALNAGATWSTSRNMTPQSCEGSLIKVDYANTVNEYSEDNNIGYEPGAVLTQCNRRPDLFVDNVWWKAGGGYSFGVPFAGEQMWFEFKIKNKPNEYSGNDACLSGFRVALKVNGQTIQNIDLPKIGCVPAYGASHPDYWMEIGHFYYTPKCDGEHLTLEVDPANSISESRENNNIWSYDIVCQLPPPIVTPS